MKTSLIFLAGGKGTRMNASTPKQYLPLLKKPIALYSFELFCDMEEFFEIVVVCEVMYQKIFFTNKKNILFATPGNRRQDSVFSGLQKTSSSSELICIHDSARPLVKKTSIQNLLKLASITGAAALSNPVTSTIKECDEEKTVKKTLKRDSLYEIQTPQVLKKDLLELGFSYAHRNNLDVTDDVELAELVGHPVKLLINTAENIKITTPFDLILAKAILTKKERG